MDTHTFIQTVYSFESLPEAVRSRALRIGEKLSEDEDREELVRRLRQVDEQTRQAEVAAEQSLLSAERQVGNIERSFRRSERTVQEEGSKRKELKKAEKELDRLKSSPSSDASR